MPKNKSGAGMALVTLNEERFRLIIEAYPNGMIMVDDQGKIILVNYQVEELFGFAREELLGKPIEMLVLESGLSKYQGYLNTIFKEPKARSMAIRRDLFGLRKDGSQIPVEIGLNWLLSEGQQFMLASIVDITERRRAEQALIKIKEELEIAVAERMKDLGEARDGAQAASRLKSEFVANMSHEIRTPMNAIMGMCNVLLKTNLDDRQYQYADNIRTGANSLLTVINDILDFSKIEAGKLELEHVDFNPEQIVESTCDLLAPAARYKRLSLMAHIEESIPEKLCGDPDRVRQILINLTSNAIKFSDHGEIIVRAHLQSVDESIARMRFSVSDQGIGVSEEQQARLFQPFVQADGSISRRFGGTGLGLSITKRLVELMKGTMGVDSMLGVGSTFWFEIPLEFKSSPRIVLRRDEVRGVKILIVGDGAQAGHILRSYVESWGMRDCVAACGKDALNLLRRASVAGEPFEVAIIDYVLLDKNAIELAAEILADDSVSNTKLILLTAFDAPGLGMQAIAAGFQAYLTKPVRRSQLLESIITVRVGGDPIISRSAADVRMKNSSVKTVRSELVLVAEDYPINQQVAQLYLDELGFASHIASNGNEALQAMAQNKYALVLMDCQMPDMDGFATTKAIRKDEGFTGEHIPIIAMTAHAMGGDRELCLAAGMDDYITKPVDPDQFQKIMDKWLPSDTPATRNRIEDSGQFEQITPEAPVDLGAIKTRYGTAGEKLLIRFLEDGPADLAKLQTAFQADNRSGFVQTVHGFKGICGAVFVGKMRAVCVDMEYAAKGGNWSAVPPLLQRLEIELAEVKEFLTCKLMKTKE